jgi:hypothetical protein
VTPGFFPFTHLQNTDAAQQFFCIRRLQFAGGTFLFCYRDVMLRKKRLRSGTACSAVAVVVPIDFLAHIPSSMMIYRNKIIFLVFVNESVVRR